MVAGSDEHAVRRQLESAARRCVVLAGRSVGRQILEGVAELARLEHVEVRVELAAASPRCVPALQSLAIGRNGDPASKIADFASRMRASTPCDGALALLKFCYADFDDPIDEAALARDYVDTLERLASERPTMRFAGVTAPLTTVRGGLNGLLRRGLGRRPVGEAENARRQRFNGLLRRHLHASRLFDLAAVEAAPGAERGRAPALYEPYTSDGGHLNARGREHVARAFLAWLAVWPS